MSSIITGPSQGWGSFFSVTPMAVAPSGSQTLIPSGSNLSLPGKAVFETWNAATQKFFIMTQGSGTPPMVPIENFGAGTPGAGTWYARMLPSGTVEIGDTKTPWQSAGSSGGNNPIPGLSTLTRAEFENLSQVEQAAVVTLRQASQMAAGYGPIVEIGLSESPRVGYEMSGNLVVKRDLSAIGALVPPAAKPVGLEPTPGMTLDINRDGEIDIPYYNLPGNAGGSGGALISAGAESLFPSLDGTKGKTLSGDKPDGFYTDPSTLTDQSSINAFLAKFNTWHSSHQMEWLMTYGSSSTTTDGRTVISVQRPPYAASPLVVPLFTIFASDTTDGRSTPSKQVPSRIVNVGSLTKQDFAALLPQDQAFAASTPLFTYAKSTELGLVEMNWTTSSAGVKTPTTATSEGGKLVKRLDDLITTMNSAASSTTGITPPMDVSPFTAQLAILRKQMEASGTVDLTGVGQAITDLETRYKRMKNYYDVGYGSKKEGTKDEYTDNNTKFTGFPTNVVSLDGGELIRSGYAVFVAQEKRLAQSATQRYGVANGDITTLNGKPLDLPTLIYYLQERYNFDLEAIVTIETEAVKQLNAYLKDYAEFQDLVNYTISKFSKDQIDKSDIQGIGFGNPVDGQWLATLSTSYKYDNNQLSSDEMIRRRRLIAMFDDANLGSRHPAEIERDIERPSWSLFRNDDSEKNAYNLDFNEYKQGDWQMLATRLGDKVTQLNQDSQQKMNDINNKDKQRNRHYDLANSALSKLNDALQSILRATA